MKFSSALPRRKTVFAVLATVVVVAAAACAAPHLLRGHAIGALRRNGWALLVESHPPEWLPAGLWKATQELWTVEECLSGPPLDASGLPEHFDDLETYLPRLRGVRYAALGQVPETPDGLDFLRHCPRLQSLKVWSGATDGALVSLKHVPEISWLALHDGKITDEGLAHLKNLTVLADLDLSHTRVAGSGFRDWPRRDVLRLTLAHTQLTDAGLASAMRCFPRVQRLDVGFTRITDAALLAINDAADLTHLTLSGAPITGAGLASMIRLAQLNSLTLRQTAIDDSAIRLLADATRLRYLNLADTGITDRCIPDLLRLQMLTNLTISGTPLSSTAMRALTRLPSLSRLDMTRTAVDGETLEHLLNAPAITWIQVSRETAGRGDARAVCDSDRGKQIVRVSH